MNENRSLYKRYTPQNLNFSMRKRLLAPLMIHRLVITCVLLCKSYGQVELLRIADSLEVYGEATEALALYDSVLRWSGVTDSLRLRAYVGSLRPLIILSKWKEVQTRVDSVLHLAGKMGDTIKYAEGLSALGEALARQGKYQGAEAALRQANGILEKRYANSIAYACLLYRLGSLSYFQAKYKESEDWQKSATDIHLYLGK